MSPEPVPKKRAARKRAVRTPRNPEKKPDTLKPLRFTTAIAWLSWCALIGLLAGQWWARALHYQYISFGLLLGTLLLASLFALCFGLWRTVTGREKGKAFGWMLLTLVPLTLLALPCLLTGWRWKMHEQAGEDPGFLLSETIGASLMEGQAALLIPNRLETPHLVMFYDRLATPQRDIAEMEQFVAYEERRLGRPLRAKIHWIRGSLLGQSRISLYGLSLGSTESPTPNAPDYSLDRHELAHSLIWQQQPYRFRPPTLISEGWAESQSGLTSTDLADRALNFYESHKKQRIKTYCSDFWYYSHKPEIYGVGGAFVDYLIRRYGLEKFRELYDTTTAPTFPADCQHTFGVPVDVLEGQFWSDAQHQAYKK